MKIQQGDQVVFPAHLLKLSFNPLKSTGQFSRPALQWFAQLIYLEDLPKNKDEVFMEIDRLETQCTKILESTEWLAGLELSDPTHSDRILATLEEHKGSEQWWAAIIGAQIGTLRAAIEKDDIKEAVWAMGIIERFRSMLVFKQHLEDVVWMGHSAKRIVDILRLWDSNRDNSDEGFWQITFRDNAYAISQIFAVPLIFIGEAAYLGGMNIDRRNSKLVDYLFSQESSREAVLVEIKTPATRLLGAKYRGTYRPSPELAGSLMQILDYKRTLSENLSSIMGGIKHELTAFSPKCVIVIGNGTVELTDDRKRRAFEMFRAGLKDVEVVTYDELFRKLEILASLFSLTRKGEK